MNLDHPSILILADGGWFSLIILLLFALSGLFANKKKKDESLVDEDNDNVLDVPELNIEPSVFQGRPSHPRVTSQPPPLPRLIRMVESLSQTPAPRRAVPTRKATGKPSRAKAKRAPKTKWVPKNPSPHPAVQRPASPQRPGRLSASVLASAKTSDLRRALVISEILAPPVALRDRTHSMDQIRDITGAI